jgi:uncharacterized protein
MSAERIAMQQLPRAELADPSRPWYREPMLWLVILLPAAAVVAALASVVTAFVTRDAVVADEYRKEGLAINRDPTRDLAARRLGVSAAVTLEGGTLSVRLAPGSAPVPSALALIFSHATRAEQDRLVALSAGADGVYSAPLPALAPGHWYVEVSPSDRSWRLTGEFVDTLGTLTLRPGTIP